MLVALEPTTAMMRSATLFLELLVRSPNSINTSLRRNNTLQAEVHYLVAVIRKATGTPTLTRTWQTES